MNLYYLMQNTEEHLKWHILGTVATGTQYGGE